MSARVSLAPFAWPRTADALGFSAPASGLEGAREASGVRALEGLALRSEGDWLALVERAPAAEGPLATGPGAPGLWRAVPHGGTLARVHDLPGLRGVEEQGSGDPGAGEPPSHAALGLLCAWAAATRRGEVAPDWTPPPRAELERWLAPSRLEVRAGALLARGELVHAPDRLALAFHALAAVPADLAPARRAWLDALLQGAHRRRRLARFGIDPDGPSVRAEVDLTGVPAAWARPLVQLSLVALTGAVEWLLASLAFVVDPGARSRALERPPHHPILEPSLDRSPTT